MAARASNPRELESFQSRDLAIGLARSAGVDGVADVVAAVAVAWAAFGSAGRWLRCKCLLLLSSVRT